MSLPINLLNQEVNLQFQENQETIGRISPIKENSPLLSVSIDINQIFQERISSIQSKPSLFLFTSGGGGHREVKEALLQKEINQIKEDLKNELTEQFGTLAAEKLLNSIEFKHTLAENNCFKEVDVLHDYFGKIGKVSSNAWNNAQKNGNVKKQENLVKHQDLGNFLSAPIVFFLTLVMLIRMKPERIVSTQPLGTSAILSAIAVYNKLFKAKERGDLSLELHMTDIPSEFSEHFLKSIRGLYEFQKNILTLHIPQPVKDFDAEKHIGLEMDHVETHDPIDLPIRPEFLDAVKNSDSLSGNSNTIQIKTSCQEERELLKGLNLMSENETFYDYPVNQDDAYYIMLGSQPTKQAIYDYIDSFSKHVTKPMHLFIFAGRFKEKNDCFFKEVVEYIKKKDLPEDLNVIPLSYQDAGQMIGLFSRCNTITRSGGCTSFELMVIDKVNSEHKANRFIHAELMEGRNSEESIPLWERGNYQKLHETIGANIITPNSIKNKIFTKA